MVRINGDMKKNQAGMTLIELLIVAVVLGVLIALVVPSLTSGGVNAQTKAQLLNRAASTLTENLSFASQYLGLPATPANGIAASGNNIVDVLMVGDTPAGVVATTYTSKFATAGLKPLSDMGKVVTAPTAGTAGSYSIGDYAVSSTTTNCAARSACWQFTGVPTEVLEVLWSELATGTFAAGTAVTASTAPVKYTAASSGTHTVTLQKRI